MISKLYGKIIEKYPSHIIVKTGGIGFEVLISAKTYEKLPDKGQDIELDIYTQVREDAINLVGFNSADEKQVFLKLLEVSGVSTKIALSSFSIYSSQELKDIISSKNVELLKRIPGVGKKLAERILLELSEKFGTDFQATVRVAGDQRLEEVRQALRSLGYNPHEVEKAIKNIDIKDIDSKKTEDILRLALKEV
ncbi:MAG: Holliday junction branch migration protein RuvA [Actinomycetota bacterium]|nr:Holliday junction branch migration protein RuvA [Actinomycetota bacterium]